MVGVGAPRESTHFEHPLRSPPKPRVQCKGPNQSAGVDPSACGCCPRTTRSFLSPPDHCHSNTCSSPDFWGARSPPAAVRSTPQRISGAGRGSTAVFLSTGPAGIPLDVQPFLLPCGSPLRAPPLSLRRRSDPKPRCLARGHKDLVTPSSPPIPLPWWQTLVLRARSRFACVPRNLCFACACMCNHSQPRLCRGHPYDELALAADPPGPPTGSLATIRLKSGSRCGRSMTRGGRRHSARFGDLGVLSLSPPSPPSPELPTPDKTSKERPAPTSTQRHPRLF